MSNGDASTPPVTGSGLPRAGSPNSAMVPTLGSLILELEEETGPRSSETTAALGGSGYSLDAPGVRTPSGPRHLHFSLAGRPYAFAIENVLEAGRPLPVTPLPFVPEWLLGISNLRGDVLSIVDLRAFLGLALPYLHPEDRLVRVRSLTEDMQVGFVVDRIQGILPLQEEPQMPTAPLPDRSENFLLGVCERDAGMLAVLDIERLLLSPAMRQFDVAKM